MFLYAYDPTFVQQIRMHGSDPQSPIPASRVDSRASLGYQIGLISRLLAQSLKRRNGKDGILPGQFPVVLALQRRDGLTQSELCRVVRIDQSTMATTLKRMHRDDIIRKQRCATDGRRSTIHLTDKGRRLAAVAVDNAAEVNRIAFEDLDAETEAEFRRRIAGILQRLQRDVYGQSNPAG